jgi:hypothetical protein
MPEIIRLPMEYRGGYKQKDGKYERFGVHQVITVVTNIAERPPKT